MSLLKGSKEGEGNGGCSRSETGAGATDLESCPGKAAWADAWWSEGRCCGGKQQQGLGPWRGGTWWCLGAGAHQTTGVVGGPVGEVGWLSHPELCNCDKKFGLYSKCNRKPLEKDLVKFAFERITLAAAWATVCVRGLRLSKGTLGPLKGTWYEG